MSLPSGLDYKEQLFIVEYMKDFNKAEAARRAGLTDEGDFYGAGYRMLQKPAVQAQMAIEVGKRERECAVDALYIIEKLKAIVEANLVKWMLLGEEGTIIENLEKMPEEVQKMVKEIKKKEVFNHSSGETTTTYTFKFMDKDRALELLGKYKGLFEKRLQLDVNINSYVQWADQMIKEHERDIINMEQRIEERRQKVIDAQFRETDSEE